MGDPLVTCMKHITYSNVYDKRTKVENFRIDKHKFMLLCKKVKGKGVKAQESHGQQEKYNEQEQGNYEIYLESKIPRSQYDFTISDNYNLNTLFIPGLQNFKDITSSNTIPSKVLMQ